MVDDRDEGGASGGVLFPSLTRFKGNDELLKWSKSSAVTCTATCLTTFCGVFALAAFFCCCCCCCCCWCCGCLDWVVALERDEAEDDPIELEGCLEDDLLLLNEGRDGLLVLVLALGKWLLLACGDEVNDDPACEVVGLPRDSLSLLGVFTLAYASVLSAEDDEECPFPFPFAIPFSSCGLAEPLLSLLFGVLVGASPFRRFLLLTSKRFIRGISCRYWNDACIRDMRAQANKRAYMLDGKMEEDRRV